MLVAKQGGGDKVWLMKSNGRFGLLRAMLALVVGSPGVFGMEIIAHRGASHDAPENTLTALKLGFAHGAEAVELDIHLTKDGKLVVMHDDNTKRTGARDRKITDQTLEEIQQLDVAAWGQWAGKGFAEKAPTLQDVLPLVPKGKRVFIEIKSGPETLPILKAVLESSKNNPAQEPIITFHHEVARGVKELLPRHEVAWLCSWKKDSQTGEFPKIEDLIAKAKEAKLDGLDLNFGFPIDKEFVAKVHRAGLKLYTWTVDDAEVAYRHLEAGVDGLTTNKPAWIRTELARRRASGGKAVAPTGTGLNNP
jgi:glycerophosphoryl diester phosphodiesterase